MKLWVPPIERFDVYPLEEYGIASMIRMSRAGRRSTRDSGCVPEALPAVSPNLGCGDRI